MCRRLRLSLLLMLMGTASVVLAQEKTVADLFTRYGEIYVEVSSDRPALLQKLQTEYVVSRWYPDRLELCLNPAEYDRFLKAGYSYSLVVPSFPKTKYMAENMEEARAYYYYPKYLQYVQLMQEYASGFPGLVRLDTIGDTPNGHQVLAVRITSGEKEGYKPKVFYTASMHGNETPCFPMMLHLIDTLLNSYGTDEGITELLDSAEVFINPLSNPDGMFRLYDTTILDASRYNSEGKDLNRNFPDPSYSPTFVPPPENRDMIAYMREHRFVLSANFHTGFTVMNYPYDRTYTPHADRDWFDYISREYADTVHTLNPNYMTSYDNGVVQGSDWFVVQGSRQDFVTYELQGREVTIELNTDKLVAPDRAWELWMLNHKSLIQYLRQALYGLRGRVYDADTGEPVPARIDIPGYDADSSHVYADSTSGIFVRLLAEGNWDLQVSAKGYKDSLLQNIQVWNWQVNSLSIPLQKVTTSITLPQNEKQYRLYPNPAKNVVHLIAEGGFPASLRYRIVDLKGRCVQESEAVQAGSTLEIPLTRLSSGFYLLEVFASDTLLCRKKVLINP